MGSVLATVFEWRSEYSTVPAPMPAVQSITSFLKSTNGTTAPHRAMGDRSHPADARFPVPVIDPLHEAPSTSGPAAVPAASPSAAVKGAPWYTLPLYRPSTLRHHQRSIHSYRYVSSPQDEPDGSASLCGTTLPQHRRAESIERREGSSDALPGLFCGENERDGFLGVPAASPGEKQVSNHHTPSDAGVTRRPDKPDSSGLENSLKEGETFLAAAHAAAPFNALQSEQARREREHFKERWGALPDKRGRCYPVLRPSLFVHPGPSMLRDEEAPAEAATRANVLTSAKLQQRKPAHPPPVVDRFPAASTVTVQVSGELEPPCSSPQTPIYSSPQSRDFTREGVVRQETSALGAAVPRHASSEGATASSVHDSLGRPVGESEALSETPSLGPLDCVELYIALESDQRYYKRTTHLEPASPLVPLKERKPYASQGHPLTARWAPTTRVHRQLVNASLSTKEFHKKYKYPQSSSPIDAALNASLLDGPSTHMAALGEEGKDETSVPPPPAPTPSFYSLVDELQDLANASPNVKAISWREIHHMAPKGAVLPAAKLLTPPPSGGINVNSFDPVLPVLLTAGVCEASHKAFLHAPGQLYQYFLGPVQHWTRGEWWERTMALAWGLHGLGLAAGDRLLIVDRTRWETLMACYAAWAVGLVVVIAPPSLSVLKQAAMDLKSEVRAVICSRHPKLIAMIRDCWRSASAFHEHTLKEEREAVRATGTTCTPSVESTHSSPIAASHDHPFGTPPASQEDAPPMFSLPAQGLATEPLFITTEAILIHPYNDSFSMVATAREDRCRTHEKSPPSMPQRNWRASEHGPVGNPSLFGSSLPRHHSHPKKVGRSSHSPLQRAHRHPHRTHNIRRAPNQHGQLPSSSHVSTVLSSTTNNTVETGSTLGVDSKWSAVAHSALGRSAGPSVLSLGQVRSRGAGRRFETMMVDPDSEKPTPAFDLKDDAFSLSSDDSGEEEPLWWNDVIEFGRQWRAAAEQKMHSLRSDTLPPPKRAKGSKKQSKGVRDPMGASASGLVESKVFSTGFPLRSPGGGHTVSLPTPVPTNESMEVGSAYSHDDESLSLNVSDPYGGEIPFAEKRRKQRRTKQQPDYHPAKGFRTHLKALTVSVPVAAAASSHRSTHHHSSSHGGSSPVPSPCSLPVSLQASDLACIYYTSGDPKGVLLTHGALQASTAGFADHLSSLGLPLAPLSARCHVYRQHSCDSHSTMAFFGEKPSTHSQAPSASRSPSVSGQSKEVQTKSLKKKWPDEGALQLSSDFYSPEPNSSEDDTPTYVAHLPIIHFFSELMMEIALLHRGFRICYGNTQTMWDSRVARPSCDVETYRPTLLFSVPTIYHHLCALVERSLTVAGFSRQLFDLSFELRREALRKSCDTPFLNHSAFLQPREMLGGRCTVLLNTSTRLSPKLLEFLLVVFGVSVHQVCQSEETAGCGIVQTLLSDFSRVVGAPMGPIEFKLKVPTGAPSKVTSSRVFRSFFYGTHTPPAGASPGVGPAGSTTVSPSCTVMEPIRGELLIRGPMLFSGYHHQSVRAMEVLRPLEIISKSAGSSSPAASPLVKDEESEENEENGWWYCTGKLAELHPINGIRVIGSMNPLPPYGTTSIGLYITADASWAWSPHRTVTNSTGIPIAVELLEHIYAQHPLCVGSPITWTEDALDASDLPLSTGSSTSVSSAGSPPPPSSSFSFVDPYAPYPQECVCLLVHPHRSYLCAIVLTDKERSKSFIRHVLTTGNLGETQPAAKPRPSSHHPSQRTKSGGKNTRSPSAASPAYPATASSESPSPPKPRKHRKEKPFTHRETTDGPKASGAPSQGLHWHTYSPGEAPLSCGTLRYSWPHCLEEQAYHQVAVHSLNQFALERGGVLPHELLRNVRVVYEPEEEVWSVSNHLRTTTGRLHRQHITERYEDIVNEMFSEEF